MEPISVSLHCRDHYNLRLEPLPGNLVALASMRRGEESQLIAIGARYIAKNRDGAGNAVVVCDDITGADDGLGEGLHYHMRLTWPEPRTPGQHWRLRWRAVLGAVWVLGPWWAVPAAAAAAVAFVASPLLCF
ncbi:hypothetical protein Pelo_10192 [Pelomyxa schiedti]|nr:hypothetical protein Pelo_10192 [Pelomyxa schiedti]